MGLLPFTVKASHRLRIGSQGEAIAIDFLKKKGLRILRRNYRFGRREIDIIARDKGTICFIEVKTRSTEEFGFPEEAVTEKKRHHLTTSALSYIKRYSLSDCDFRFDVISIFLDRENPRIEYIRDAFAIDTKWML